MNGQRQDPSDTGDERQMLEAWLEYQRATLMIKCDGLSAAQLRSTVVQPSKLSLLGMVQHLAQVEQNWFRRRLAGEDASPLFYPDDDPLKGFGGVLPTEVANSFAVWRAECSNSRAVLARVASLDELASQPRRGQPISVRAVLLRVITEYARHNGHADLLRERLDGSVGV